MSKFSPTFDGLSLHLEILVPLLFVKRMLSSQIWHQHFSLIYNLQIKNSFLEYAKFFVEVWDLGEKCETKKE